MYHLRRIKVLLATCLLVCTSLWAQDVKITISSATASSYHNDDLQAANAIDGNFETIWHSNWNDIPSFPVDFVITLEKESHVDYVRYTPRLSGTNGNWKKVDVSYSTSTSSSSFISSVTYDLKGASSTFDFPIGAICGQIKFTIYPGETDNGKNLASAAEIAAYAYDTAKPAAFAEYFNGDVYSELKPDVTSSNGIADADVKALVEAMLADAEGYKKFRVGEYEPYMTTATVRNNLKTNALYNNYENPTGIYLKRGESCIIAVSGIGDYPVGLKIKDWYKSGDLSTYKLRNGLNYITATTEGNVFVDYYTDDFKNAPNVQMHFINAPVLGYWDQATMTNADWVSMLAGPLTEDDEIIIITRSEHAQTAYPVKQWKTYCPTDVDSTMTCYQQVQWAERDILGLEMYERQVKNRQLFYADKSGSMYAGGDASVCGYGDLRVLVAPDAKVFDFWGVGHEWGHNNQMAGFYWTGCGETTNNIPASWAQFKFTGNRDANGNPTNLRLEDEVTGINDYKGMRGGRMQTYFEEGLRKGVQWQLQDGPDWHAETPTAVTVTGRDENGNDLGQVNTTWRHYDHFVKLAPFWQLNLWGTVANKNPYIITKVIEAIRVTDNYTSTYNTNGKQQINWMKLACQGAEMDLLPFFEKAGMLRPIHAYVDDYAKGWNIITEEMMNELKASVAAEVAAGRYQAYPDEEINYINGHNYHIYRDNLELNVTAMEGERNGDKVTIQHSVAQNAVAFETYNAQDELIRITMYGLGSDDTHSYTQVLFPSSFDESENAAYIMAVGYDGERQRVYQTYANEDEAKYGELGRILTGVEAMQAFCDDTKVGYYKSSALTDLNAAYNKAKAVYDKKESAKYAAVYDMLNTEFMKVQNDATARVGIVEGNAYRLTNRAYPTLSMSAGTNDVMIGEQTNNNDVQKWYFEGSGTEGYYYLKNKATNTYPGNVETSQSLSLDKTTKAEAHAYKLQDMGDGIWALVGATGLHCSASQSYNIVGWGADAEATQWYITVVETNPNAEALNNLQVLVDKAEALIAEIEADGAYSTISTSTAQSEVATAKNDIASGTYNESVYNELNDQYTALLNAKKSVDDAALDAKKLDLSTLIDNANSLIAQCGTVVFNDATPDTELALQTSNESGYYYLSTNAYETEEGNLDNLIDESDETYFHSAWSWDVNAVHYLKVDMGEGKSLKEFTFTYKTTKGLFPTVINVYGSNDDSQGELLHTFTKDNDVLPTEVGRSWTSSVISSEAAYRYIRFEVTESDGGGYGATPKGEYCFVMSYFGITEMAKPESYTVTLGNDHGDVTEELLLTAFKAVQEAQSVVDYANTEAQVNEAIEKLQEQYQTLDEAKKAVTYVEYTISTLVEGGGVIYKGQTYTTTLTAPNTLTVDDLDGAVEVEGYVVRSITINGTEISIIYNKVYTVTITGGEGEGRVTFGDDEYANGETFDALQNSFAAADLTAKDVTGYTKSEVTVNHETGAITVVYTLNTSALSTLIEETNVLMQACQVFVNSAYVTEQLLTNTSAAITSAMGTLSKENLTYAEYTKTLTALQTANTTLTQAKISAEAEAAERTELNGQLSALITETKTLIASCYENEVLKFINSEFVTEETISAVRTIVADAEAKCAYNGTPASEYNASIDALTEAKSSLVTAIENAEEEAEQRVLLKAELQDLVNNTNTLMALCGEIRTAPATTLSGAVGLQTTQSANNFYLSTNAQEKSEGPIAGLTDDDKSTFFHSSWKARMGEAHYLQVDMGAQYALKEFAFGYVTRDNGGGGPHPSTIVVSGSNSTDNDSFVELRVINSGLPTDGNESWSTTENIVTPKMPYRYLRFTVTLSAGTNGCKHSNPDEYFFTMSKFSLTAVPTEATPYADVYEKAGVVTEAQLLEVYYEKESAQSIINSANNTELTAAKEALQAKYDALNTAYTTINKSELEALLPEAEALINSCYTDETFNYTGSLYVTAELMTEVEGVISAAHTALDNTVSQEEYDVALADLRNAQAELQYAVDHAWLPVILTTNINAPVLYVMNSKRGASKALQYDPAEEHTFCIAEKVESSVKQAFFFMEGDAATQVYVYPFAAGGQVLSADNTDNGAKKVFAKVMGEMNKQQWTFHKQIFESVDCYGLKPVGTNTYLSNYGGGSAKMGFFTTLNDGGSLFTFTPTTIKGSAAYHSLNVYYAEAARVASSEIVGGDEVGYYPETKATAYNTAYSTATDLLDGESFDYATYFNAYEALKTANEALELIMPEVGKYYRFVSVVKKNDETNSYANVYANPADNKMYWAADKATGDATAMWTFVPLADGKFAVTNLHTGSSINTFINYNPSPLGETAGEVSIVSLSLDGQIGIKCGDRMMHAQGGGAVVHWETGADDGSAWRIVEVDVNAVMHTATLKYEHAGLFLNYAVAKPEGVKAYYIDGTKEINIVDGVGELKLTELEGDVIPARTAVILYAPEIGNDAKTYDFYYTTDDSEIDNLLTGSAYTQYLAAEADHAYYSFGQKKGQVGLYKNSVKYVYDDEQSAYVEAAEDATHYKVSANKVLFDWDASSQGVTSFRFRMGDEETGIEGITIDADATIYDLYGRRVLEVVTPGLYIVNGEKRYVKVK